MNRPIIQSQENYFETDCSPLLQVQEEPIKDDQWLP